MWLIFHLFFFFKVVSKKNPVSAPVESDLSINNIYCLITSVIISCHKSWGKVSLRSWRDSVAGERVAEPPYSLAKPARELTSGEAASEFEFNSTLHQSSHGLAARVHGFSNKTKALVREIPPATQAKEKLKKFCR